MKSITNLTPVLLLSFCLIITLQAQEPGTVIEQGSPHVENPNLAIEGGYLKIGDLDETHLSIDKNSIQTLGKDFEYYPNFLHLNKFGGEVGINLGNSFPNSTLDVNGSVNIRQGLLANGIAGTTGQLLSTDANGNLIWTENNDDNWIKFGNHIYNNSDRVGIGIGSIAPSTVLEIASSGNSHNDSGLAFRDNNANRYNMYKDQAHKFYIGFNGTKALTIDPSGNLGIGNVNPNYKLDVNGDINTDARLLANGVAGTDGQVLTSDAFGNISWEDSAGGSDTDWIESGNDVYRISGNLGIGITPSTSNKVHILGDQNISNSINFVSQVNENNIASGNTNTDLIAVYGLSKYDLTNINSWGTGGYFNGGRFGVQAFVNHTSNHENYPSYGGYFYNRSDSRTEKYGVYSFVGQEGTATKYAIYGEVVAAATTGLRYGVYGKSSTTGSSTYAGYFNGNLNYTGTLTNFSDKRLKKNIQRVNRSLSKVLSLNPSQYEYKIKEKNHINLATGIQIGFVAQEVEKVIPELVSTDQHVFRLNEESDDGEDKSITEEIKSINYIGFIPILTGAIQEQQVIINKQEKQIDDLSNQVSELSIIVNRLNQELNTNKR